MNDSTIYSPSTRSSPRPPGHVRTHRSPDPECSVRSRWRVVDLLGRLQSVRSAGEGKWTAKCPASNDRRPSLSVAVGVDGKVLVNCFAGCRFADVIAAAGLDGRHSAATTLERGRHDSRTSSPRAASATASGPTHDFAALARRFQQAISNLDRERLAASLAVSPDALARLGVGSVDAATLRRLGTACRSSDCFTFPMHDAAGDVIGVRLRLWSGFKYAIKASRSGLFLPVLAGGFDVPRHGLPLFLVEGPTDAAALLDCGHAGIGRPSSASGYTLVAEFVRRHDIGDVVVVADGDEAGRRGATRLAKVLAATCGMKRLRIAVSPPPFKDVRDWRRSGGATSASVASWIGGDDPHDQSSRPVVRTAKEVQGA